MKLYTEEQVERIAKLYRHELYVLYAAMKTETPIELPSDEEIEKNVTCSNLGLRYDFSMNSGFRKGAKWMRDKIQGGNK